MSEPTRPGETVCAVGEFPKNRRGGGVRRQCCDLDALRRPGAWL